MHQSGRRDRREAAIRTPAIVLESPGSIAVRTLELVRPQTGDVVVEISDSGVSTGTERLFWTGHMPPFPGMSYPLVPGYEAIGEVIEVPPGARLKVGDRVFVPGANCFEGVRGLFGAAARRVVTSADRILKIDAGLGPAGTLMALAATARHAIAGNGHEMPDLIVGHGVLGRLLARLVLAAGGPEPRVWETDPLRRRGAAGYEVLDSETDGRRDYRCIFDATGNASLVDVLIGRIAKGGEIVLAGFYSKPIAFAFPPAFVKELRLRVAAEWNRDDLIATRGLIESGALSLDGLITHRRPASEAEAAYPIAFDDPDCLKMVLNWGGTT